MTDIPSNKAQKAANPAPRRLIIIVIGILCLGILASALFTFATLSRLRTYYFSNRGHEIASIIEAQTRGPGRRNNPSVWQSVLEANYETYSGSVAFLELLDQNGNLIAGKGKPSPGALESGKGHGGIYIFEETLSHPRNIRSEVSPVTGGWRLRIGIYEAGANFIKRPAFLQLVLSGMAIAALVALSLYLVRTLDRFLEMKEREGAETQLKSLGIMAASLAHEIRNPLGAMKGLTQLAQEDLSPDHAAQAPLQTVISEAERLERLVADLLDFARPKAPQISEFSVTGLLTDIKAMLQSRLEASQVSLQYFPDPGTLNIRSDPGGLRQVLLNVILNAVDASPAGSAVVLRIAHDEGNRSLLIQIDDSGPGLGEGSPEELFQPFVTTKARGTGLGLAVSRRIVENLGGSLALDNHPHGGARCSILLPLHDKGNSAKVSGPLAKKKDTP